MATVSELAAALARSLGVPERTMHVCARHVREAGLIAQKGRGPSAAQMGPRDATNLLLGIAAANELQDAAACAARARALVCVGFERDFDGKVIDIRESPYRDGFLRTPQLGEVLERMIDYSARFGDLRSNRGPLPIVNLSLDIDRPGFYAEITFDDHDESHVSHRWVAKFGIPASRKAEAEVRKLILPRRAMTVSTRVDLIDAIADIAEVLLGRQPAEGEMVSPPWAAESAPAATKKRISRSSQRGKNPTR